MNDETKRISYGSPYLQHPGALIIPEIMGLTLEHWDFVGPPGPLYASLMSASSTFSHGMLLLQAILTTTGVAEVPLIFLKLTSLIFTFDGACKRKQERTLRPQ